MPHTCSRRHEVVCIPGSRNASTTPGHRQDPRPSQAESSMLVQSNCLLAVNCAHMLIALPQSSNPQPVIVQGCRPTLVTLVTPSNPRLHSPVGCEV
eukprot:1161425-Pelagomonas_calceolata.AAC.4